MVNDANTDNKPEFAIQRIYVKDLSFESPNAPEVFRGEWKPEVKFELNTSHNELSDNNYEVTLAVTVTAEVDKKVAFLVEVKQSGIFTISGIEGEQKEGILGSFCPTILFPYLRETVSDIVTRGSFPQLYLAPINFDAVYAEHLKQKKNGGQ
ncbi:MAG: protein-export chaperone SecB [Legionellales bacterium]|nr:protein-export chaperone SecB [Legionellales bacterium]